MAKDVPRYVWEEEISAIRERLAVRVRAAKEGDEEAAIRAPELKAVLDLLLKGYADKFNTNYPLPDKEDSGS